MFETAETILDMLKTNGMTQEKLAEHLAVSQSFIANKLRLLRFDEEERERIIDAGLSERHARALLRLRGKEVRQAAADVMIERRMTVADADVFIDRLIEKEEATLSGASALVGEEVRRVCEAARLSGIRAEFRERNSNEGKEFTVICMGL